GPDVGYEVLAQRLMARIERRSWSTESMGPVETCRIPMDVSPTNQVGPAVPIGAAGGWVHPATGYQLGSALFRAEGVAKQIVESMGMSHRAQAQALLSFLSPRGAMLRQGLHRFGRDLLLDRNTHELRVLFDAFFSLPDVHRRAWLDADAPVADVAVAMLTLFSLAPWRLRADLARGLVQHQGLDLARSLFPASLAPHFGGNA
ncbi:MAG: lycopene beta-cyclase, partial [Kiritimatiellia bacterium]